MTGTTGKELEQRRGGGGGTGQWQEVKVGGGGDRGHSCVPNMYLEKYFLYSRVWPGGGEGVGGEEGESEWE